MDNWAIAGAWTLLVCGAGAFFYARVLDPIYPIRSWLAWDLATIWYWIAAFVVGCVCLGQWFLVRVLKLDRLPVLESAVFSMTTGTIFFALSMYLAGVLHAYRPWFAVVLPLAFTATGARHGWALASALARDIARPSRGGPLRALIFAFGVFCVSLLYLGILSPDSLNYDSSWYHLTVSQDYAREGRIVPFLADYNRALPQLHALLNTWSYLVPGLAAPPLRWMLCLHLEFALFLWTLAGVAAAIRALVRDDALRGAWVSFFLFPIIFIYDSNMGGSADHVCAFFTPAILLAMVRVWPRFGSGAGVLLALCCGGALLTKYQAGYLILVVAGLVLARAIFLAVRWRFAFDATDSVHPRVLLRQLTIIVGLGALVVLPHFLKNFIFYNNPVYPFAQAIFKKSWPNVPHGDFYVEYISKAYGCRPHGPLLERCKEAAKLFFTFSFEPHCAFVKGPTFGSLFTFLLPVIPFLRERMRIGIAAIMGAGALLVWCLTFNVDRNLQVFMPVLVCATGAIIVSLWRMGWLARVGILPLICLQLAWGGDALFYDSDGRIASALGLIRTGFDGRAASRYDGYRSTFRQIGSALPADAVVLLHSSHSSLGIDRKVLFDFAGFQGLVTYTGVRTPRELCDYFRSLGITHLLEDLHARPASSKQEEVLWNALTAGYAKELNRFGSYVLYALPDAPPPVESSYRVATLGMDGYGSGIYAVEHLDTAEYLPGHLQRFPRPDVSLESTAQEETRASVLALDAVLVGASATLDEATQQAIGRQFGAALRMPRFTLYLHRERLRREE